MRTTECFLKQQTLILILGYAYIPDIDLIVCVCVCVHVFSRLGTFWLLQECSEYPSMDWNRLGIQIGITIILVE